MARGVTNQLAPSAGLSRDEPVFWGQAPGQLLPAGWTAGSAPHRALPAASVRRKQSQNR